MEMVKFQASGSVEMGQVLLPGIHPARLEFTPGDLDAASQFLPGGGGRRGNGGDGCGGGGAGRALAKLQLV